MFQSARIKLTTWYLVIIMTISICFSAFVYRLLSEEFDRFDRIQRYRFEHIIQDGQLPPPHMIPDPSLLNEVKQRLVIALGLIDLFILIVSGILSYFLAGRTLKPIQSMVDEQNRFISDASHELRTPLTALKSSMEVFLRDHNSTIDDA